MGLRPDSTSHLKVSRLGWTVCAQPYALNQLGRTSCLFYFMIGFSSLDMGSLVLNGFGVSESQGGFWIRASEQLRKSQSQSSSRVSFSCGSVPIGYFCPRSSSSQGECRNPASVIRIDTYTIIRGRNHCLYYT